MHLEKEVLPSLNPATLEDSGPIIANHETPLTSHAPSEDDSTQPTTPSSVMAQFAPRPYHYLSTKSPGRATSTLPLPIIPVIPNISFAFRVPKRASISTASEAIKAPKLSNEEHLAVAIEATSQNKGRDDIIDTDSDTVPSSPPKPAPKSWADLVRAKAPRSSKISDKAGGEEVAQLNGFLAPKTTSLSEALSSYSVDGVKEDAKISFLEPRGLVNTGNMCYMNSVGRFN